jgi:hypothetical protein
VVLDDGHETTEVVGEFKVVEQSRSLNWHTWFRGVSPKPP